MMQTLGERGKPDGAWDGASFNILESNFKYTSSEARIALGRLFPSNKFPESDSGSPNDGLWREVADKDTYTFLDDRYSESELFHINKTSFNIMTVEQNYMTQIVNLTRSNGEGKFNIHSVTSFNILKGNIQLRQVETFWGGTKKIKYRILTVTETMQLYKDNQAFGNPVLNT